MLKKYKRARQQLGKRLRTLTPTQSLAVYAGFELTMKLAGYTALYYYEANRFGFTTDVALFWLRWEGRFYLGYHLLPNAKKSKYWPLVERALSPVRSALKPAYRKIKRSYLRFRHQRSSKHASP